MDLLPAKLEPSLDEAIRRFIALEFN